MMTCTIARIISTSASILGALTSVNVNKTCTSLMENAKVTNYNTKLQKKETYSLLFKRKKN